MICHRLLQDRGLLAGVVGAVAEWNEVEDSIDPMLTLVSVPAEFDTANTTGLSARDQVIVGTGDVEDLAGNGNQRTAKAVVQDSTPPRHAGGPPAVLWYRRAANDPLDSLGTGRSHTRPQRQSQCFQSRPRAASHLAWGSEPDRFTERR